MKGGGDRKTFASETPLLEGLDCFFDLFGGTGQNELRRGVLVGHHQVEIVLVDNGFDRALIGVHCQHGATVALALAHELPAKNGKNTQRLSIEHLCRM